MGRWKQEEVEELINLTRVYGRGKWKAILEHSGNIFQHRNQVLISLRSGAHLVQGQGSGLHGRSEASACKLLTGDRDAS